MKDLDHFLADLSDSELAIFIAYRFDDFLDNSKQKIIAEVDKRKLTHAQIKELFNNGIPTNADSDYLCPRCSSPRFHVETDYELKHHQYSSYEIAIETNRCQLCGFNPDKSKQKGIANKIKKWLGYYRNSRLKRPEIDGRMFTR